MVQTSFQFLVGIFLLSSKCRTKESKLVIMISGMNIAISHIVSPSLVTSPTRYARPPQHLCIFVFSFLLFFFTILCLSTMFVVVVAFLRRYPHVYSCTHFHYRLQLILFFFFREFVYFCFSVKFEAQASMLSFWG